MITTQNPARDEVLHPEEPNPELATARGFLILLAETAPEPLSALIAETALAHLDDVRPPLPPAAAATSDLRGVALHDEAITALIRLAVSSGDPAVRACALSAMTELTTPLEILLVAPGADPGVEGGEGS